MADIKGRILWMTNVTESHGCISPRFLHPHSGSEIYRSTSLSAASSKAQTITSMAINAILGLAGGYTAADTEPSHYATKVSHDNEPAHGTSISRIPQLCIA